MSDIVKASECRCCECGEPAVTFWPVYEPDIPSYPYCRKCLDRAKQKLMMELLEIDKKYEKK